MRNASTGQFSARALLLAVGLVAGVPVVVSAQNAPVPDNYTVRKGDTLWDLAKTFFGDPLTWPQIYKMNTAVIEDPHWIYPGEVLQIAGTGQGVIPAQQPMASPVAAAPAPAQAEAPTPVAAAEPVPPGLAVAPAAAVEPEVYAEVPDQPSGGARVAGPISGDPTALFGKTNAQKRSEQMLVSYAERVYSPLRPGEFYSAGFLSEGKKLPYGEVRGDVVPPQIANLSAPNTASQFTRIGVVPPKGASYQVGDSLLLAARFLAPSGYGDIVYPTGIARVDEVGSDQVTAVVLQQFQRIKVGMVTLPLERFSPGGAERAVPVSDGIEAEVIAIRSNNVLVEQQGVLFLNKGREDGVAPGDVFELWRTPETRWDAANTVAEPMARVQVVRVGDHSSSALIVRIISADIGAGTRARQIAKLPN